MPKPRPDSNISLAQLAYETYLKSLRTQLGTDWHHLAPATQAAWRAVVHKILNPP